MMLHLILLRSFHSNVCRSCCYAERKEDMWTWNGCFLTIDSNHWVPRRSVECLKMEICVWTRRRDAHVFNIHSAIFIFSFIVLHCIFDAIQPKQCRQMTAMTCAHHAIHSETKFHVHSNTRQRIRADQAGMRAMHGDKCSLATTTTLCYVQRIASKCERVNQRYRNTRTKRTSWAVMMFSFFLSDVSVHDKRKNELMTKKKPTKWKKLMWLTSLKPTIYYFHLKLNIHSTATNEMPFKLSEREKIIKYFIYSSFRKWPEVCGACHTHTHTQKQTTSLQTKSFKFLTRWYKN